jgi:hypothetical protein
MSEMEFDREAALDQFSDGELEAEVTRREKIRSAPPNPRPDEEIDWERVKNSALEYIQLVNENKRVDNSEHFIFESVVMAVYGKDVWEWINKRLQ